MNILFLMPDQLRWDFLGCYGADFIDTSHIDGLARDGITYDMAISPAPICVPIRAAMLSGLNPIQSGVITNDHWLSPHWREQGLMMWPAVLARAGYDTAAIGKMHFYPWDAFEGFAYRRICEDKRHIEVQDDYAHYLHARGLRKLYGWEEPGYYENKGASCSPLPLEHYPDVWCTDRFLAYLDERDPMRPFAAMVGFPSPHCPYNPPEGYLGLHDPADMPAPIPETDLSRALRPGNIANMKQAWNRVDYTDFPIEAKMCIRAHYADLVKLLDDQVGRILDGLEERGLAKDTIVVFASDHGDYLGDHSLIGKQSFLQPSVHVPLIVRIPGRPEEERGQRHPEPVSLIDLYASFLALAGLEIPDHVDSVPLPGLVPGLETRPREFIFGAAVSGLMAMQGRHILAHYGNGARSLYGLEADPTEQHNLYDEPAAREIRQALTEALIDSVFKASLDRNRELLVQPGSRRYETGFGNPGWRRPFPFPGFFSSPDRSGVA